MRAKEFITEATKKKKKSSKKRHVKPPTKSQCSAGRSKMSNVRRSQCVSRGWAAHNTDHTDGNGKQGKKGSGKSLRGVKGQAGRSEKFGGRAKNYGGSHS